MGWLDGQSVVVTGAASGLGRAIVERFLAEGARVVALDRAEDKLAALEREANAGDALAVVAGDVTKLDDNKRAVARAVERFGRLDVLVGNAGIYDHSVALADIPEERLEAAFDE